MKSLTHHRRILSNRFHIVHQMRNIVARFHMLSFLYKIAITIIMIIEIIITKYMFIGNDRETHVLNAGVKIGKLDKKFWL